MKRRSEKTTETEVNLWDHTLLEGPEGEEEEENLYADDETDDSVEESPWQEESEHDEDEEPDAYGFRSSSSRW